MNVFKVNHETLKQRHWRASSLINAAFEMNEHIILKMLLLISIMLLPA